MRESYSQLDHLHNYTNIQQNKINHYWYVSLKQENKAMEENVTVGG